MPIQLAKPFQTDQAVLAAINDLRSKGYTDANVTSSDSDVTFTTNSTDATAWKEIFKYDPGNNVVTAFIKGSVIKAKLQTGTTEVDRNCLLTFVRYNRLDKDPFRKKVASYIYDTWYGLSLSGDQDNENLNQRLAFIFDPLEFQGPFIIVRPGEVLSILMKIASGSGNLTTTDSRIAIPAMKAPA